MAITKSTPAPLTGGTLWCVTIALSLATFMQMLDSTISNVAIPTISGFLGASTDEGTWVITSFGVANAIAIPVTGRLAQRIGELRLFLLSVTFSGINGGAVNSTVTEFIIKELSTRKKNICSGIMVYDRDYRADMWADIGRLYL